MWQDKLVLKAGETLVNEKTRIAGSLGNEDITTFDVQDSSGAIVGTVRYTDVTSIKAPFRRSFHLHQRNAKGESIVDERGVLK